MTTATASSREIAPRNTGTSDGATKSIRSTHEHQLASSELKHKTFWLAIIPAVAAAGAGCGVGVRLHAGLHPTWRQAAAVVEAAFGRA